MVDEKSPEKDTNDTKYLRQLRQSLIARGLCVRCCYKMIDIERAQAKECWKCRTKRTMRGPSAKSRQTSLTYSRLTYANKSEEIKAERRALTEAKKLRGECRNCPRPSLEDSLLCEPCRTRESKRRKKRIANKRKHGECISCSNKATSRTGRCDKCQDKEDLNQERIKVRRSKNIKLTMKS